MSRCGEVRSHERGTVLVFVSTIALLLSIASYAILRVASSEARQSKAFDRRSQARYVAEAGIVLALERLRVDGNYPQCPPGGSGPGCCDPASPGADVRSTHLIDTSGPGAAADGALTAGVDAEVEVEITNCGAGRAHTVRATARY